MCPRYILVLLLALTFAVANSVARSPTLDSYPPKHKRHYPPLEEEENTQVNNYHGPIHKKHPPLQEEENTEVNNYHGKPTKVKGKHPPKEEEKHEVDSYHHLPLHPPSNNPPHGGHGDHHHQEGPSQEDSYRGHKPPHPPTPVN